MSHILLVDDNDELREFVAESLIARGYSVTPAANGSEALAFTGKVARIDLVITDVMMPRMSGYDLAAQLRRAVPDMKFLFISGHPMATVAETGMAAVNQFLAKPFSMAQLARVVRELLL
ncbi:MAG TPA: response regulator [Candidatus Saccharimonadales bacterium]|nr:response regulator [Candidatus Saccharimonadales bacterium]